MSKSNGPSEEDAQVSMQVLLRLIMLLDTIAMQAAMHMERVAAAAQSMAMLSFARSHIQV